MSENLKHLYWPEPKQIVGLPPEDPYNNMLWLVAEMPTHTVAKNLNEGHKSIELPLGYTKIHSGKVRDTYEYPWHPEYQIIVATDRVSTHDVVHNTAIPNKWVVLTQMSKFWFDFLKNDPRTKDIKTHMPEDNIALPDDFPEEHRERAMVVKKLIPLPLEAIVRWYLYGSVTKEYASSWNVCGIPIEPGILKAGKFPEPLFTPSTKGAIGQHDENMTGGFEQMVGTLTNWEAPIEIPKVTETEAGEIVLLMGKAREIAEYVREKSVLIYTTAAEYAQARGIILADTKFEWALDVEGNVVLIDEVLTPDSSRFWEWQTWVTWEEPVQFDKQPLRADAMKQWEAAGKIKEKPPLSFSAEVLGDAQKRYTDIQDRLTA